MTGEPIPTAYISIASTTIENFHRQLLEIAKESENGLVLFDDPHNFNLFGAFNEAAYFEYIRHPRSQKNVALPTLETVDEASIVNAFSSVDNDFVGGKTHLVATINGKKVYFVGEQDLQRLRKLRQRQNDLVTSLRQQTQRTGGFARLTATAQGKNIKNAQPDPNAWRATPLQASKKRPKKDEPAGGETPPQASFKFQEYQITFTQLVMRNYLAEGRREALDPKKKIGVTLAAGRVPAAVALDAEFLKGATLSQAEAAFSFFSGMKPNEVPSSVSTFLDNYIKQNNQWLAKNTDRIRRQGFTGNWASASKTFKKSQRQKRPLRLCEAEENDSFVIIPL